MRHSTFFWFFLPTGAAMLFFIAFPIVSVLTQSVFAPHEAVLIEVESCTPIVGCTTETKIDQDATRELRAEKPIGRFVGLDIYFDRGHLAVAEVGEAWATSETWADFRKRLLNLPLYRALAFTMTFTLTVTPALIVLKRSGNNGYCQEVGSWLSGPAIACSSTAASATVRVIGPTWSSESARANTP